MESNYKQCLICLGTGCNGNCPQGTDEQNDSYWENYQKQKSKTDKGEKRERQKEYGWRKGWHR
ncbi:MAG: hypothetical protein K1X86_15620 [Ignavibacteria bacterium]|nr:hypothetical protein [Ignavibacteria bacterium]